MSDHESFLDKEKSLCLTNKKRKEQRLWQEVKFHGDQRHPHQLQPQELQGREAHQPRASRGDLFVYFCVNSI